MFFDDDKISFINDLNLVNINKLIEQKYLNNEFSSDEKILFLQYKDIKNSGNSKLFVSKKIAQNLNLFKFIKSMASEFEKINLENSKFDQKNKVNFDNYRKKKIKRTLSHNSYIKKNINKINEENDLQIKKLNKLKLIKYTKLIWLLDHYDTFLDDKSLEFISKLSYKQISDVKIQLPSYNNLRETSYYKKLTTNRPLIEKRFIEEQITKTKERNSFIKSRNEKKHEENYLDILKKGANLHEK